MAREIPIFNSEQLHLQTVDVTLPHVGFSGGRGGVKHITSIRHHINHRCLTSTHQTHPESLTNGTHKVMIEHG